MATVKNPAAICFFLKKEIPNAVYRSNTALQAAIVTLVFALQVGEHVLVRSKHTELCGSNRTTEQLDTFARSVQSCRYSKS